MYFNHEDNDDAEKLANKIDKAAQYHADKIISQDIDEVSGFIQVTSEKVLQLVEEIEDDSLAIALTQLLGAVLGGVGKACLELKAENLMLKHDILENMQGGQDPELN